MPQPRTFRVTLYPIFRSRYGSGFVTKMTIGGNKTYPTRTFEATTTAQVLGVVQRMAQEHGRPCDASVTIKKGDRKPAGFDEAVRRLLFFTERAPLEGNDVEGELMEAAS